MLCMMHTFRKGISMPVFHHAFESRGVPFTFKFTEARVYSACAEHREWV